MGYYVGLAKKVYLGFSEICHEKTQVEKKPTQKTFRFVSTVTQGNFVSWKTCCGLACKLKDILGDGLRPNIRKSRIKTHRLVQRKCHNRYHALTGASQRKTCHVIILICGTQRNSTEGPIQDRRWATDIENKLWLPEGEQGYREVNWELEIDTDTLLYIK